jgi:hypothetical protein
MGNSGGKKDQRSKQPDQRSEIKDQSKKVKKLIHNLKQIHTVRHRRSKKGLRLKAKSEAPGFKKRAAFSPLDYFECPLLFNVFYFDP